MNIIILLLTGVLSITSLNLFCSFCVLFSHFTDHNPLAHKVNPFQKLVLSPPPIFTHFKNYYLEKATIDGGLKITPRKPP